MNYQNFCAVLTEIEKHPEEWDQGSLYQRCFGGIAATLSGYKVADPGERWCRAKEFLGLGDGDAVNLFDASKTLEQFRCIRVVQGWAHLAQQRAQA